MQRRCMQRRRRAFPTDLTDAHSAAIAGLVPQVLPGGRPRRTVPREIVTAILHLLRGGQASHLLPHDLPPWRTVCDDLRRWQARRVGEAEGQPCAVHRRAATRTAAVGAAAAAMGDRAQPRLAHHQPPPCLGLRTAHRRSQNPHAPPHRMTPTSQTRSEGAVESSILSRGVARASPSSAARRERDTGGGGAARRGAAARSPVVPAQTSAATETVVPEFAVTCRIAKLSEARVSSMSPRRSRWALWSKYPGARIAARVSASFR